MLANARQSSCAADIEDGSDIVELRQGLQHPGIRQRTVIERGAGQTNGSLAHATSAC